MTGVGLALPQLGGHVTAEVLRGFCERAEALGFTSLWVQDHFAYPHDPAGGYAGVDGIPVPEAYRSSLTALEVLAAAAAWTTRVRLGTSVLVAGHHRPAPLAKQLATLDHLAQGRLAVGLGVGWCHEEHALCEVDPHARGRRMDDFLPALLACWGPDPVAYEGPVFSIPPCDLAPKPLQPPRPLLLAGMWSPAGRRRTVAWCDGWNPAGMSVDEVRRGVAAMDAERGDRPPLRVFHRVFVQFPRGRPGKAEPGVEGVTRDAARAREAGFDEVIVECNFWDELDAPARWLEVPDRLRPALDAASG